MVYLVSDTGEIVSSQGPWHHKYLETDFYYSANSSLHDVEKITDMLAEEKFGKTKYWWMRYKLAVEAIGAVIVVLVLISLFAGGNDSGGSSSDDVYPDRTPFSDLMGEYYKDM